MSGHRRLHTCTCVPLFPFPLLPPPTPCLCCWEPVISAILLSICSSRSNMDILNWLSGLGKARVRTFPWKGSSGFDSQLQEVKNSYPGSDRGDLLCLQTHTLALQYPSSSTSCSNPLTAIPENFLIKNRLKNEKYRQKINPFPCESSCMHTILGVMQSLSKHKL